LISVRGWNPFKLLVEEDADVGAVAVDLVEIELGGALPQLECPFHLLPDLSVINVLGRGWTLSQAERRKKKKQIEYEPKKRSLETGPLKETLILIKMATLAK